MTRHLFPSVVAVLCLLTAPAFAQVVETTGSRALAMGGAFVAVADDHSATWWNPAGVAAGPFLDAGLSWAVTGADGRVPARRDRAVSFALATPVVAVGVHRLRVTGAGDPHSTGQDRADRQDGRAGVPIRSLSATQVGATFVHTLALGVHAGATLKYVRGTLAAVDAAEAAPSDLLAQGERLDGSEAIGHFDLDVGILAVARSIRIGGVMRNVRRPEFDGVRLPRQVRVGAAFDGDEAGVGPWVVALDADVRAYDTSTGARRVVAVGGEHWLFARRVAVRAGARVNTVGDDRRSLTAGASLAVRAGLYLDGHVVAGGADDETGWGLGARVSF